MAALRTKLGLDQPDTFDIAILHVFSGDLGVAVTSGRPVSELILVRIGNTFFLAIVAAAIAVPLALCLGMLTALLRNTVFDRVAIDAFLDLGARVFHCVYSHFCAWHFCGLVPDGFGCHR